MNTFSALLVLAAIIGSTLAVDYCAKELCSYGTHIGCRHNGQFDRTCPKNAVLVKMDTQLRDFIVAGFNEKRNYIAGGGDSRHRPACRMATMEWDDELAKLAELNVKQCRMKHDTCRNTKAFPMSGQNLAWQTFYNEPNYTDLVQSSIQMWYDEVKQSKMAYIKKYPQYSTGAVIGHFTAMVADRNFRLGCAASIFNAPREESKQFLFACNFAFTNIIHQAIYADCDTSGTSCATGKNPKYPNLCSTAEKYKVSFF